jgi:hypothetical protein
MQPLFDRMHQSTVRFWVSSPNRENGFVSVAVRFVDQARSSFTGCEFRDGVSNPPAPAQRGLHGHRRRVPQVGNNKPVDGRVVRHQHDA